MDDNPVARSDHSPGPQETGGPPPAHGVFHIKDCALIAVATGKHASSLRELRDVLQVVEADSIYYHFWGGRLRARFDEPEFQNEFAAWVNRGLHDGPAAERLGVIDPTACETLEDLRTELIDVLEERLEESESLSWARSPFPMNLLRSQIVVFDTHRRVADPRDLAQAVEQMSAGSIFYHLIDARRRTANGVDDLRNWLAGFGDTYQDLSQTIADIDPFFSTLTEVRLELTEVLADHFARGQA